jgi:hypothetical protein
VSRRHIAPSGAASTIHGTSRCRNQSQGAFHGWTQDGSALEVAREARGERLAGVEVRPQDARDPVGDGRHHQEDHRREGEAAQERLYINASQT